MHWAERAAGVPENELADVHQEAVLKIHRCAATFRHRSSVVTWMVTIAHRTALNFVTAQHRRSEERRVGNGSTRGRAGETGREGGARTRGGRLCWDTE